MLDATFKESPSVTTFTEDTVPPLLESIVIVFPDRDVVMFVPPSIVIVSPLSIVAEPPESAVIRKLDILLLKVVKFPDVKYPSTEVVAAAIEIAGAVPPDETTGEVPVTPVTVPVLVV